LAANASAGFAKDMEQVQVAKDKHSFILADSGRRFIPWGFNYDHDAAGRLTGGSVDEEWS